jgi:hypothetical protein
MIVTRVLTAICSIMFFMIGADKFLLFLEPPCSLQESIPFLVWSIFGVIQIVAGVLIWLPKYRRSVSGFFFLFMTVFTIVHLVAGTHDVGGAVFMAFLLGFLAWNPKVLQSKSVN